MLEVMAFMLGFSGIVSVYEICRTGRATKANKIRTEAEKLGKEKEKEKE